MLGVGVDELVKQGYMKHLLPGPLYWVDTADRCDTHTRARARARTAVDSCMSLRMQKLEVTRGLRTWALYVCVCVCVCVAVSPVSAQVVS